MHANQHHCKVMLHGSDWWLRQPAGCIAGSLGLCSNLAQLTANQSLSVLGGTTSPTTSTQPQFTYAFSACQDTGTNPSTLRIFGFSIHLAQVLLPLSRLSSGSSNKTPEP